MMPDLTLPPRAPTAKFSKGHSGNHKLAIYTIVNLGSGGIDGLTRALSSGDQNVTDKWTLPPSYGFEAKPLKAVYDYHLQELPDQVPDKETVDASLFIVAQYEDYEKDGVLLVNLDADLNGQVDTCRIATSEALLAAANLQISNMDWEDFKEDELPETYSDGSNKGPASSDPSPQPSDVVFGAYGIVPGANMTAIRGLLEPDWRDKDPKSWLCEAVGSYTDDPEPLQKVIRMHPWHCHQKQKMHRQWCICVDNKNPKEQGVLLVYIPWDGNIDRDPNQLLDVGPQAETNTERVSVGEALRALAAK